MLINQHISASVCSIWDWTAVLEYKQKINKIKKWQCVLSLWAYTKTDAQQAFQKTKWPSWPHLPAAGSSRLLFCPVFLCMKLDQIGSDQSDLLWSNCVIILICPACEARLSWFSGHVQLMSLQTLVLPLRSTQHPWARAAGGVNEGVRASALSVCCDLCQEMCCT